MFLTCSSNLFNSHLILTMSHPLRFSSDSEYLDHLLQVLFSLSLTVTDYHRGSRPTATPAATCTTWSGLGGASGWPSAVVLPSTCSTQRRWSSCRKSTFAPVRPT